MICLIVEAPLAENNVCTRIFNSFNHVCEVILLHLLELFVILNRLDFDTVLGLRFWGLKRAGQDGDLYVAKLLENWKKKIISKVQNITKDVQ